MSEPAQKCDRNAILKQNYTLKLFAAFKMAIFLLFRFRGKSRFSRFPPKKFYNINYSIIFLPFSSISLVGGDIQGSKATDKKEALDACIKIGKILVHFKLVFLTDFTPIRLNFI